MTDLEAFEVVAEEISEGRLHQGLWLQCLSKCEGDPEKTRGLYANERARMLQSEATEKAAQLASESAAKAKRQRAELEAIREACSASVLPSKLKMGEYLDRASRMEDGAALVKRLQKLIKDHGEISGLLSQMRLCSTDRKAVTRIVEEIASYDEWRFQDLDYSAVDKFIDRTIWRDLVYTGMVLVTLAVGIALLAYLNSRFN